MSSLCVTMPGGKGRNRSKKRTPKGSRETSRDRDASPRLESSARQADRVRMPPPTKVPPARPSGRGTSSSASATTTLRDGTGSPLRPPPRMRPPPRARADNAGLSASAGPGNPAHDAGQDAPPAGVNASVPIPVDLDSWLDSWRVIHEKHPSILNALPKIEYEHPAAPWVGLKPSPYTPTAVRAGDMTPEAEERADWYDITRNAQYVTGSLSYPVLRPECEASPFGTPGHCVVLARDLPYTEWTLENQNALLNAWIKCDFRCPAKNCDDIVSFNLTSPSARLETNRVPRDMGQPNVPVIGIGIIPGAGASEPYESLEIRADTLFAHWAAFHMAPGYCCALPCGAPVQIWSLGVCNRIFRSRRAWCNHMERFHEVDPNNLATQAGWIDMRQYLNRRIARPITLGSETVKKAVREYWSYCGTEQFKQEELSWLANMIGYDDVYCYDPNSGKTGLITGPKRKRPAVHKVDNNQLVGKVTEYIHATKVLGGDYNVPQHKAEFKEACTLLRREAKTNEREAREARKRKTGEPHAETSEPKRTPPTESFSFGDFASESGGLISSPTLGSDAGTVSSRHRSKSRDSQGSRSGFAPWVETGSGVASPPPRGEVPPRKPRTTRQGVSAALGKAPSHSAEGSDENNNTKASGSSPLGYAEHNRRANLHQAGLTGEEVLTPALSEVSTEDVGARRQPPRAARDGVDYHEESTTAEYTDSGGVDDEDGMSVDDDATDVESVTSGQLAESVAGSSYGDLVLHKPHVRITPLTKQQLSDHHVTQTPTLWSEEVEAEERGRAEPMDVGETTSRPIFDSRSSQANPVNALERPTPSSVPTETSSSGFPPLSSTADRSEMETRESPTVTSTPTSTYASAAKGPHIPGFAPQKTTLRAAVASKAGKPHAAPPPLVAPVPPVTSASQPLRRALGGMRADQDELPNLIPPTSRMAMYLVDRTREPGDPPKPKPVVSSVESLPQDNDELFRRFTGLYTHSDCVANRLSGDIILGQYAKLITKYLALRREHSTYQAECKRMRDRIALHEWHSTMSGLEKAHRVEGVNLLVQERQEVVSWGNTWKDFGMDLRQQLSTAKEELSQARHERECALSKVSRLESEKEELRQQLDEARALQRDPSRRLLARELEEVEPLPGAQLRANLVRGQLEDLWIPHDERTDPGPVQADHSALLAVVRKYSGQVSSDTSRLLGESVLDGTAQLTQELLQGLLFLTGAWLETLCQIRTAALVASGYADVPNRDHPRWTDAHIEIVSADGETLPRNSVVVYRRQDVRPALAGGDSMPTSPHYGSSVRAISTENRIDGSTFTYNPVFSHSQPDAYNAMSRSGMDCSEPQSLTVEGPRLTVGLTEFLAAVSLSLRSYYLGSDRRTVRVNPEGERVSHEDLPERDALHPSTVSHIAHQLGTLNQGQDATRETISQEMDLSEGEEPSGETVNTGESRPGVPGMNSDEEVSPTVVVQPTPPEALVSSTVPTPTPTSMEQVSEVSVKTEPGTMSDEPLMLTLKRGNRRGLKTGNSSPRAKTKKSAKQGDTGRPKQKKVQTPATVGTPPDDQEARAFDLEADDPVQSPETSELARKMEKASLHEELPQTPPVMGALHVPSEQELRDEYHEPPLGPEPALGAAALVAEPPGFENLEVLDKEDDLNIEHLLDDQSDLLSAHDSLLDLACQKE